MPLINGGRTIFVAPRHAASLSKPPPAWPPYAHTIDAAPTVPPRRYPLMVVVLVGGICSAPATQWHPALAIPPPIPSLPAASFNPILLRCHPRLPPARRKPRFALRVGVYLYPRVVVGP